MWVICRNAQCPYNYQQRCGRGVVVINEGAQCKHVLDKYLRDEAKVNGVLKNKRVIVNDI